MYMCLYICMYMCVLTKTCVLNFCCVIQTMQSFAEHIVFDPLCTEKGLYDHKM